MSKYLKIAIILVLVIAAGVFVYSQFIHKKAIRNSDLEVMKQRIIADPKVNAPNLTDAEKTKFLQDFKNGKAQVLQFNFDILQGVNEIALAKEHLGDFAGAEIAWQYANIIRPQNSLSFSNLAALYQYDLKEYDKAEQNYLISIANDPQDIPTIRNFYDLYHLDLKENDKAEALLLNAIQQNPTAGDLDALLGSLYEEEGKLDRALEYFQKALSLSPNNTAIKTEIQKLQNELKK